MEKYEKWIVFGLIGLAIYYFYKKFKSGQANATTSSPAVGSFYSNLPNPLGETLQTGYMPPGSIVNPTNERFSGTPYQTSNPILFNPAQPSTVPVSQRVSAGILTFDAPAPFSTREMLA